MSLLENLSPSFSDTSSAINVATDFLLDLFSQKIMVADTKIVVTTLLDSLTKGRTVGEVLRQFGISLKKKFYLLPIDLELIQKIAEGWIKGKMV